MEVIEKVQSAKLATNEKLRKLSISAQALDLQSLNSIFIGNFQTFSLASVCCQDMAVLGF